MTGAIFALSVKYHENLPRDSGLRYSLKPWSCCTPSTLRITEHPDYRATCSLLSILFTWLVVQQKSP